MFLLWVDVCYNKIPGDYTSDLSVCLILWCWKCRKRPPHHITAAVVAAKNLSHFYLMSTNGVLCSILRLKQKTYKHTSENITYTTNRGAEGMCLLVECIPIGNAYRTSVFQCHKIRIRTFCYDVEKHTSSRMLYSLFTTWFVFCFYLLV